MANVHIALVGGQTYPVYLGIAESASDRVYLVHSQSSLDEAKRIKAEFDGSGIPFILEACDPVNGKQVIEKAQMLAKILSDDDNYTIDLTSGTKVWSILFYKAFENKPNVRFIYIDQSCNIHDLATGDCRQGSAIDTDRIFRLNNTKALKYCDFNDLNDEDLMVLDKVERLHHSHIEVFNELTIAKTKEAKQAFVKSQNSLEFKGSTITWDKKAKTIEFIVMKNDQPIKQVHLCSPHVFELVFNAGWFEAEVARRLSSWKYSREVRMNVVFPYSAGNAKNEIDVIVNTGTRLLFVECKTQIHDLTDLDKFSKAVRNYGGTGCHALFVTFAEMNDKAIEKCRDNGIIPFSFKDALVASHQKDDKVITRALHQLLVERLFTINKK